MSNKNYFFSPSSLFKNHQIAMAIKGFLNANKRRNNSIFLSIILKYIWY